MTDLYERLRRSPATCPSWACRGNAVTDLYERLQQTAGVLAERTGRERHDVCVVLGSGLGGYRSVSR